jgi:GGDEF domain-containing protein
MIVRDEDTVCRLGGDEFVVLLPYIEKDGDDILGPTALIAAKILRELGQS